MELKDISHEPLDELLTNQLGIIFAQTSPQQKLITAVGCERQDAGIAVTKDAVHDFLSIKKADRLGLSWRWQVPMQPKRQATQLY